jgi:hypothetical protein
LFGQGASTILKYYKGNITKALISIFPDIGLDKSILRSRKLQKTFAELFSSLAGFWGNLTRQKKFFENYAKENGFDSQDPQNWYTQAERKIMATKVFFLKIKFIVIIFL